MVRRAYSAAADRKMVLGRIVLREQEEQANGVTLLRRIGATVYVTSQGRASHVTPGLPDVLALIPSHGALLWEVKTEGGKLSEEQKACGAACREAGVHWCAGPVVVLLECLCTMGVIA